MSVPFVEIAGQKVRLAWQVLGKAGPIDNPRGIRYLAPHSIDPGREQLRSGLPDVATAFSGINVLIASGKLALSAQTLAEVKRMSSQVDKLLTGQRHSNEKLDRVLEKLTRLELKGDESQLAEQVDYAVRAAARGDDEVDFNPLCDLAQHLQHFVEEAGIVRGIPAKLRLGSEVRASLRRVYQLLRGVRWQAARWHNRTCDGPDQVWLCHAERDYWSDVDAAFAIALDRSIVDQRMNMQVATFAAHRAVDERFTMNGAEDHLALQHGLNLVYVQALMDNRLDEAAATALVTGVHEQIDVLDSPDDHASHFLSEEFTDEYVSAMVDAVRESTASAQQVCYPPALIDAADDRDETDALDDWRSFWLHQTDVGLVYKTYRECLGVRDGYAAAFELTPQLDDVQNADAASLLPPVVVDFDLQSDHRERRSRGGRGARPSSVRPLRSSMPVPRNRARGAN